MKNPDISKIKSIHFVGIKGVAMTALAIVAKEMGKTITGSDVEEEFPTKKTLNKYHIQCETGFNPNHINYKPDLVIYTGAHQGRQNIEVQTAINLGIPVLPHGKALGLFMNDKFQISVAGSHGKTTASAMLAFCLMKLRTDPSFAIGCGEILGLQTSGHFGSGKYFVAEADEYITDPTSDQTPRFLWQQPDILIITNIDFDHPDAYKNIAQVQKAFIDLTKKVPANGHILINADDPKSLEIIPKISQTVITYGLSKTTNYQIKNIHYENNLNNFDIWSENKLLGDFKIKNIGNYNAINATAVIIALKLLGFSIEQIKTVISEFSGTKRRFEFIGENNQKLLYDDYAHHPTEINATLKGVKEFFPDKKIIVIFQPHTYSRTAKLLDDFAKSFQFADQVIITDIYASAREKPISNINGRLLVEKIKHYNSAVKYLGTEDAVLEYIKLHTKTNDLILTMGAGSIYSWIPKILKKL